MSQTVTPIIIFSNQVTLHGFRIRGACRATSLKAGLLLIATFASHLQFSNLKWSYMVWNSLKVSYIYVWFDHVHHYNPLTLTAWKYWISNTTYICRRAPWFLQSFRFMNTTLNFHVLVSYGIICHCGSFSSDTSYEWVSVQLLLSSQSISVRPLLVNPVLLFGRFWIVTLL
jgi:hypothetical protein